MTDVMLFHSMYGLRPAVSAAAERLRDAGHRVVAPDLFDGRTADSVEGGAAIRDEIGRDELLRRAIAASARPPGPRGLGGAPIFADTGLVYAGFSLGGSLAQTLALNDERARGLLLLHGTADLPDDANADDLPVQLHVADPDPFEPHDWLSAWYLRMRKAGADVEVYRYPGAGHLYTDPELRDHDAAAAEATWRVALGFLDSLDEPDTAAPA